MSQHPTPTSLDWTLEIVPAHADQLDNLAGLVSEIFVTMIPGTDERKILGAISQVQAAGFRAVPHLAARCFASEEQLTYFCDGLREQGVDKILVLAGGLSKPEGPYTNTMQILQSTAFQKIGVSTVALAGHPEGNPVDPAAEQSLREKLTFLREQGTTAEIVTQWSFSPEKVNHYLSAIQSEHPDLVVRIGAPGPATFKTLLKYAKICGVTAVTEVFKKQGFGLGRLLTTSNPTKFISKIEGTNSFHLYPFGGLDKSAEWLQQHLESARTAA